MFNKRKQENDLFDDLCEKYYAKILRYLYAVLNDEDAARDCTQEVFLIAFQKRSILLQHPNCGGFLFQTAKILSKKTLRESFAVMLKENSLDMQDDVIDTNANMEQILDSKINEQDYIELVLSDLSVEKRQFYTLYYIGKNSMADIAAKLGLEETTVRMRYVRLRREIRSIAAAIAEQYFSPDVTQPSKRTYMSEQQTGRLVVRREEVQ